MWCAIMNFMKNCILKEVNQIPLCGGSVMFYERQLLDNKSFILK